MLLGSVTGARNRRQSTKCEGQCPDSIALVHARYQRFRNVVTVSDDFAAPLDARRAELRRFLRGRRRTTSPEVLGLPLASNRRRNAGVRIEELCAAAGVGITWYSALENGRPIRMSQKLLDAIASALAMSADERRYLFALAAPRDQPLPPAETIRGVLIALAENVEFGPAYVVDDRWNVLGWNAFAGTLFGFAPRGGGNLVERMFLDPSLRAIHLSWPRIADELVAVLHMNYAFAYEPARFDAFIERMRAASAEFAERWEAAGVRAMAPKRMRVAHPAYGTLTLETVGLQQSEHWHDRGSDWLIVQRNVDDGGGDSSDGDSGGASTSSA